MLKFAVNPGDEFAKADKPQTVWIVGRYVDHPGLPQHVELIEKLLPNSRMTIAISALHDGKLFQRLDKN